MLQLLQQRQDFVFERVGCDRTDLLVTHHAGFIDDKGFGHAVYAVIDADAAIGIDDAGLIRVAEPAEPRECVSALVFVVEAINRHDVALRKFDQHRMFFAA